LVRSEECIKTATSAADGDIVPEPRLRASEVNSSMHMAIQTNRVVQNVQDTQK